MKKEAILYQRHDGGAVTCLACQRRCTIPEGKRGWCRTWLSLGSVGCNFRCPGCQNWEIAHWRKGPMFTEYVAPERSVAMARERGCDGCAWEMSTSWSSSRCC